MKKIVKHSWLLFVFFSACEQKAVKESTKSLPAGGGELTQLYFLLEDSALKSSSERQREIQWAQFVPERFSQDIPAHQEVKRIKSLDEAVELLQQWNGRPVDFLFLGLGLPQEAWAKLKIPNVAKRQTIALLSKNTPEPNVSLKIIVDTDSFSSFKKELKKQMKSELPLVFGGAFEDEDYTVRLSFDWSEFIRSEILAKRDGFSVPAKQIWGFSSPFLKIEKGRKFSMLNEEARKNFDEFVKEYNLKVLQGSHGRSANQTELGNFLKDLKKK